VKLDTHVYKAIGVSDEEMTLDIVNFGEQVTAPAMGAVVRKVDDAVGAEMASPTPEVTVSSTRTTRTSAWSTPASRSTTTASPPLAAVPRRRVERRGAILKSDRLSKFDTSGSSEALREAIIGRIAGFTAVTAIGLDPDIAIAAHRRRSRSRSSPRRPGRRILGREAHLPGPAAPHAARLRPDRLERPGRPSPDRHLHGRRHHEGPRHHRRRRPVPAVRRRRRRPRSSSAPSTTPPTASSPAEYVDELGTIDEPARSCTRATSTSSSTTSSCDRQEARRVGVRARLDRRAPPPDWGKAPTDPLYEHGIFPLTVLARRQAVLGAGGFHADDKYEDWSLWNRMADQGARFVVVPKETWTYRTSTADRRTEQLVST
jgi:hypothetical protein